MKYKVIEQTWLPDFEKEVNNHLESGWKLQGGVSASRVGRSGISTELTYYQALIIE